ncbi:hypothetical protein LP7551_02918 [Roseibium album]|nr:hypothetical protein LP7551_02918 [Roseibium album]
MILSDGSSSAVKPKWVLKKTALLSTSRTYNMMRLSETVLVNAFHFCDAGVDISKWDERQTNSV